MGFSSEVRAKIERDKLADHLEAVLDHIAYVEGEEPFTSARAALEEDSE